MYLPRFPRVQYRLNFVAAGGDGDTGRRSGGRGSGWGGETASVREEVRRKEVGVRAGCGALRSRQCALGNRLRARTHAWIPE